MSSDIAVFAYVTKTEQPRGAPLLALFEKWDSTVPSIWGFLFDDAALALY
jgi:hypothetical protein